MNSSSRDHAHTATGATPDGAASIVCSFCGFRDRITPGEGKHIITSPPVSICQDCVALCVDIIAEASRKRRGSASGVAAQVPADKSREAK